MKIYKDVVNAYAENFYLYYDETSRKGLLIDPGDQSKILDQFIADQDIQIEAILLTHGHWDHIQAANHYRSFYQAPIYGPETERWLLEDPQPNDGFDYGQHDLSIHVDHYFKDGELLTDFAVEAIACPGHTRGSTVFRHGDILFTGDCLFQGSVGRWDLPTGSLTDTIVSVRKLLETPGDARVYPGHGPMTALERERQFNAFYQAIQDGQFG